MLFRWQSGCTEENVINLLPEEKLEPLLTDPQRDKTGDRLRTLKERLAIEEKEFLVIKAKAGSGLKALILEAALGKVPPDKASERKRYQSHTQKWFKTIEGGRELAEKVFSLGIWPNLKPKLMPFCNAVRKAVGLEEILDLDS